MSIVFLNFFKKYFMIFLRLPLFLSPARDRRPTVFLIREKPLRKKTDGKQSTRRPV